MNKLLNYTGSIQYRRELSNGIELNATAGVSVTDWEYEIPSSIFGNALGSPVFVGFSTIDGNENSINTTQFTREIRLRQDVGNFDWSTGVYGRNFVRESPFLFSIADYGTYFGTSASCTCNLFSESNRTANVLILNTKKMNRYYDQEFKKNAVELLFSLG